MNSIPKNNLDENPQPDRSLVEAIAGLVEQVEQSRKNHFDEGPQLPDHAGDRGPDVVRYNPTLARLSLALKLGPAYRLYVYLMHRTRARGGANLYRLSDCPTGPGFSMARLRQLADQGENIYWKVARQDQDWTLILISQATTGITLASLASESGIMNPDETSFFTCFVSLDLLLGNLRPLYAEFFAGWLTLRKNSRYRATWGVLEKLWGRSRSGLLAWLNLAGIQRDSNYGYRDIGPAKPGYPQNGFITPDDGESATWLVVYQGRIYQYWQRGNTYQADPTNRVGSQGRSRQIREAVNAIPDQGQREPAPYDKRCGDQPYVRTNYGETGQATRAIKALQRTRFKHPHLSTYFCNDSRIEGGRVRHYWHYTPAETDQADQPGERGFN